MLTLPALGASLAFLPIAGRPLDLMASYFVKAILKPNQYVYQKSGGSLSFMELNLQPVLPKPLTAPLASAKSIHAENKKAEQLMNYLYSTPQDSASPLDQKESQLITSLFNLPLPQLTPQGPQVATLATNSLPPAQGLNTDLAQEPSAVAPPGNDQANNAPVPAYEPIPPATVLDVVPNSHSANDASQPNPSHNSGNLHTGMEFPNLINGNVKDARGNVLPGILVEVLNKDNDSVRAFRTNSLGQFVSATQLANGSYTITFEDPKNQHKFESVKIEANGSVLPPLSVVSVDAREELRRSLFG